MRGADRSEAQATTDLDRSRSSDGAVPWRRRCARWAKWVLALDLAVVALLFVAQGGLSEMGTAAGALTAVGRLAGLLGTNLVLVQLLLMGRNPWLDRTFGMDRLARWHRVIGHASFDLIVVHVVSITLGYAQAVDAALLDEVGALVLRTRDVLMATVALGCLVMVVLTSVRAARRRLRYETWYFVHLYAYLGIALAVPHEIYDGADFVGHPITQAYWVIAYSVAVGSLVWFRFVVPLRNMSRHQLRVVDVVEENDDVVSIYIGGRDLHLLRAEPGQFFIWRFLCRGQWWQAHPYSLSAAPKELVLRITVKDLGDGSAALWDLPIGTPVIAEGPYGAFTGRARSQRKVLLVAGGVGITPIRALAEALPARRGDITLLYRVTHKADAVFVDELRNIAGRRGATVRLVSGPRERYPSHLQPFSPQHLRQVVPDVVDHDVYVCGPEPLTQTVIASLRRLGVPDHQIHHESFAY